MTFYVLAGAFTIVLAAFLRREPDKYLDVCVATWFVFYIPLFFLQAWLCGWLHPQTLDGLLYRADLALGLDPLAVTRFVAKSPASRTFLQVSYDILPLVLALAYTLERSAVLLRSMAIAPLVGFVFYNLVPAAGPAYAFVGTQLVPVPPGARNCFPSLHLAWALLAAWNTRGFFRFCAWIFVALTVVSTVGIGEHYFIDLFAAVPFTWAVQKAAVWWAGRSRVITPNASGLP